LEYIWVARGDAVDIVTTECGTTGTDKHSDDVYVVGVLVHRKGDANELHTYGDCTPEHTTNILEGSLTVFANGKGVARLGDFYNTVDYVSTVNQGSVYAG
jgi:uncharacterized Zn-binding protein involved in type VI secretion